MPNVNSPRLILSPEDIEFSLTDVNHFVKQLANLKLISSELKPVENYHCFDLGEDFLHLITYLGCSPTIYNTDDSSDNDTFISIAQHETIQFALSSAIPPARCPHCHKTDKNWSDYFQRWIDNPLTLESCPQCNNSFRFTEMKWKKNGGYGKLFLQIHGIQEQLAIPNQTLLDDLEAFTNTRWIYFFAA